MDKMQFFMWFIEAWSRLKSKNPTFFVYLARVSLCLVIGVVIIHILVKQHVPLPAFLTWLDEGFFVGLFTGTGISSQLTVKREDPIPEAKGPMPLTDKKDVK